MAAKPLTSEAIALTEKKMDMTLDDIIKMSKNTSSKGKKQQQRRISNKSQRSVSNFAKVKAFKVQQYMNSRSSLRQGVLAQRRSNFQGNRFPFAAEAAQRAAVAPFQNRAFNSRRVPNLNKPRIGAQLVRRAANGGFAAKMPLRLPQQQLQRQQEEGQRNTETKQKPKTLDSLFANMKEERMRVFSHQKRNVQSNGGGGRQRMAWGRGRIGK